MALATQCPHCGTTFRVAHDQLKLRAGLVRCGACKEIFNGIEHLLPAAPPSPAAPAPAAAEPLAVALPSPSATDISATEEVETEPPLAADDVDTATDTAPADVAPEPADDDQPPPSPFDGDPTTVPRAPTEAEGTEAPQIETKSAEDTEAPQIETESAEAAEPLYRMTLMDFAPAGHGADDAAAAVRAAQDDAALDRALDDLQGRRPSSDDLWPPQDGPEDFDEPDFIARARRQRRGGRVRRALLACACVVLLLAALGQAAYAFRSQLAARFPQARPLLAAACATLGCRIELPMQIENVTIESSELQALAPDKNTFALSVLLRNRSSTVEAWPSLELTLNDAAEQPLVRRVFGPRDYLPTPSEAAGFAATSEQAVRVYFELSTAKAAGYRVYLFYP